MVADSIENNLLICLADHYGLSGSLKRLAGENLNYLLTTQEGRRYVAKVVDDDTPSEVIRMEFDAMEYAASTELVLQLPRIIQNNIGKIETGIKIHTNKSNRLRLLTFLNGNVLESLTDISDILLDDLGHSLAEYHLAMRRFHHPAARRSHRWNPLEAGQHRDSIGIVKGSVNRALLRWALDDWQEVENKAEKLPWQFIHGDMNRENILVSGDRVTGLVDFGDSGLNPTVCDLAICLAYMMMGRDDPLRAAAIVSRGYRAVRALSDAEWSVIYPLICGRLATTILISTTRRRIDPENPNWFGSEKPAWRLLGKMQEIERVDFIEKISQ